MPTDTTALGRFGHHPDPTIDFCVEVEEIDAIHYDVRTGIAKDKEDERNRRIARAMSFRVGGDEKAVAAKDRLRAIKREAAPPNPVAEVVERLRWYARHYFSHVPRYETLTLDRCMSINEMLATAADEIERLSREKEAGEFWSGVFSEITDKTEREKIAAELTDFHFMMDQVPQVYMHITGGRMSKTNYYAADVIAEADDYAQECFRKDTDAEIEPLKAEIERLSRERDTADEHFVVINGPDGACVEVVSGRDRLVETCRNILWSGEGDVPEDVLAILDTVGNPDADEWTEHGAPARLRFDFEDGALEILRVNFMPRAVSRERDTGVPEELHFLTAVVRNALQWHEDHRVEIQKIGPGTIPQWVMDGEFVWDGSNEKVGT